MRRAFLLILLAGLSALSAGLGCGQRAPEPIEYQANYVTLDGLRQVKSEGAAVVFVRPGVRMADFDELLVDPFMVSYASAGGTPDAPIRTLDRETEERLTGVLREAFADKMQYSDGFELVEEAGPKAVRVQGWLYDLVVEAPPSDDPRNFPLCFAQVTVLLTVRHSVTAQALAQVAERTQFTCKSSKRNLYYTARWKDVTEAMKPWAKLLRDWLEDLRERPPA